MTVDRRELAAIFAGGVMGALARAALVEAFPVRAGSWPWATFVANVAGAFLLGYFATRLQERLPVSAYRRPLLGTGFCGALTTFSTVQLELVQMLSHGDDGLAAAYAAALPAMQPRARACGAAGCASGRGGRRSKGGASARTPKLRLYRPVIRNECPRRKDAP